MAELEALVQQMNAAVDAAIVEGPNDRRGLRRAGFEKSIYTCAEAGDLVSFAASLSEHRLVILTDFDPKGRELNARFRTLITGRRVRPEWRRKVGGLLTAHGRRDIESLNNLFERRW